MSKQGKYICIFLGIAGAVLVGVALVYNHFETLLQRMH
jgi:hypothetical protein